MAGGWWYLWTDGGVGGWGLVARACWRECVRCLWCPCVLCQCCARWTVCRRGGGSVLVVDVETKERPRKNPFFLKVRQWWPPQHKGGVRKIAFPML